jgi:hypothetical protein
VSALTGEGISSVFNTAAIEAGTFYPMISAVKAKELQPTSGKRTKGCC